MNGLERVRAAVRTLYRKSEWDWFFPLHVEPAASYAREIAKREGVSEELCVLAALLHDLARVSNPIDRPDPPDLMEQSLGKAEELMGKAGYPEEDTAAVKAAIFTHSCTNSFPATLEGKVLATADALAHFLTGFYQEVPLHLTHIKPDEKFKPWAREKIERDFRKKIFFEKDREQVQEKYKAMKGMLA